MYNCHPVGDANLSLAVWGCPVAWVLRIGDGPEHDHFDHKHWNREVYHVVLISMIIRLKDRSSCKSSTGQMDTF